MSADVRLAWLFDIDGTLLLTAGAARESFVLATRDVLGRDDDLDGVGFLARRDDRRLAGAAAVQIRLDIGLGQRQPRRATINHHTDSAAMQWCDAHPDCRPDCPTNCPHGRLHLEPGARKLQGQLQ